MRPGRVLGLDLGDARIGVAISDDERRVAVPLGTVHVGRPPGELRAVADLIAEHDVTLVVVGLPIGLDGSRGSRVLHAEAFIQALQPLIDTPVQTQDERLSTAQAERSLRDAGVSSRDQRRVVDATAAQIILQAWLDRHAG